MADALLDKSLDALIEENRNKLGTKGRKGSGVRVGNSAAAASRLGRGGLKGRNNYGVQQQQTGRRQRAPLELGTQGKKIGKTGRRAGTFGVIPPFPFGMAPPFGMPPPFAFPPMGTFPEMGAPSTRQGGRGAGPGKKYVQRDPDRDSKWVHDMHDPTEDLPKRRNTNTVTAPPGTKLQISNLHYNVSDQDIKELFSTVGELVSSSIDYDESGRSLCTATVMFKRSADATKAMQQYGGVALDGQKLEISMVQESELVRLSSGIRVTKEGGRALLAGRMGNRVSGGAAAVASSAGPAGRMFQQALPRGMGGDSGYGAPTAPSRRPVGGSRIRSSVVVTDDMHE